MELPNQEKNDNASRKGNAQILRDTIKQVEMQEKKNLRRTRKLLEAKVKSRNLIKGLNAKAILSCKILGAILKVDKRRT